MESGGSAEIITMRYKNMSSPVQRPPSPANPVKNLAECLNLFGCWTGEREQAELYLLFPADFSIKAHLVLFRDITLGADQYADDPGVSIPGRGVERSVAVLKCNNRLQPSHLPGPSPLTYIVFQVGLAAVQ